MKINAYYLLKVSRSASYKEINNSYKTRALKYHPDKNPDHAFYIKKFIDITEAYSILCDPETRRTYDIGLSNIETYKLSTPIHRNQRTREAAHFDLASALQIFMNFIRKNDRCLDLLAGEYTKGPPFQGPPIQVYVPLTLQEISQGCQKTIHITHEKTCQHCMGSGCKNNEDVLTACHKCTGKGKIRIVGQTSTAECFICYGTGQIPQNPCPVCHGKGIYQQETEVDVVFPKGISEGNFIVLNGLGDAGIRGNGSSDLILFIEEKGDDTYFRRGYNIETELTVPMTSAVLGDTFEVEDIYGKTHSFRIKPGTQPGAFYKIEGRGLPFYNQDRAGDLYIQIHVEIPKMLSDDALLYFKDFIKQIDRAKEHDAPRKIGNYYVIDLNRDEKVSNFRNAFHKADTLLSSKRSIAFNLSQIDFIDSVGLGMMLKIHKKLTTYKSSLVLIGLSEVILEIMQDCSLDIIFTIVDNESCLEDSDSSA